MKTGYKTTEFWVVILTLLSATVLRALHDIDPAAWAATIGAIGTGYQLSRGLAKVNLPKVPSGNLVSAVDSLKSLTQTAQQLVAKPAVTVPTVAPVQVSPTPAVPPAV